MNATPTDRRSRPRASTGPASAPISRCSTREVHGKPLVYLDSANTGQKPRAGDRRGRRLLPPPQRQRQSRACTRSAPRRPTPTKARARKLARLPQRARRRAGAVQRHHLRDQPGRLLAGRCRACSRATRSCSRAWSTTPTSCRGSWSPSAPARSDQGRRARRPTASSTSTRCTRC